MKKKFLARGPSLLCIVVACATAATLAVSPGQRRILTEDRNRDGRPDAWRQYDDSGQLTEIDVDSNFDGLSDIAEYYDGQGALLSRQSDLNFNGRIDLIEEFDPVTHEHARSVVDVDDDGTADLIVLFRDGLPVFAVQAPPAGGAGGHGGDVRESGRQEQGDGRGGADVRGPGAGSLIPLVDPFRADTSLRGTVYAAHADDWIGLSTSTALPRPRTTLADAARPPTRLEGGNPSFQRSAPSTIPSPRGPPSF